MWSSVCCLLCRVCLCRGTWVTFSAPISEEVAEEIVVSAFESGINVFDLSDGYCGPRAELSLGRILRQRRWRRSSFVVITKIYWSYRSVAIACLMHFWAVSVGSEPVPVATNRRRGRSPLKWNLFRCMLDLKRGACRRSTSSNRCEARWRGCNWNILT